MPVIAYQRLRQTWRHIQKEIRRRAFAARRKVNAGRTSFSVAQALLKSIAIPTLLAVLLILFVNVIESVASEPFQALVKFMLSIPWVGGAIDAGQRLGIVPTGISLNSTGYVALLSTLASVAGVFLALYFTTLGVVASTVYARVQNDIRDLVLREHSGTIYVQIVALLLSVTILLLTGIALGWRLGTLSLILVGALGVASVFSFINLSRRLFHLFAPSSLAPDLLPNLLEAVHSVTVDTNGWDLPEGQRASQQQAEYVLNLYHSIVRLETSGDTANGSRVRMILDQLLSGLTSYVALKSRIPTRSYWFKRILKHRTWLTASSSQIDIALATGTPLLPEEVPDTSWFEDKVQDIMAEVLQAFLKASDFANAAYLGIALGARLQALAGSFAMEETLALVRAVRPILYDAISDSAAATTSDMAVFIVTGETSAQLALADLPGSMFIEILLGLSKALERATSENLVQAVRRVSWSRVETLYRPSLPRTVIQDMESMAERFRRELEVEERITEPEWYQTQLVAASVLRFVSTTLDEFIYELEQLSVPAAESLLTQGRAIYCAQVVERGIEACQKSSFHLRGMRGMVEDLANLRRDKDLQWTEINWDGIERRIHKVQDDLAKILARTIPALAELPISTAVPDYFGHAVAVLSQDCYLAVADGQEAIFSELFKATFVGSLLGFERARYQLRDFNKTSAFLGSSESLINLFELSGYAIIYSELDTTNCWQVVKETWDSYLSRQPDTQAMVKTLYGIANARASLYFVTSGDLIRRRWKQDLEKRLRDHGLPDTDAVSSRLAGQARNDVPSHPSILIRTLLRGGYRLGLFCSPKDVFFAMYMAERPEAVGQPLPSGARQFQEAMQRNGEQRDKRDRQELVRDADPNVAPPAEDEEDVS